MKERRKNSVWKVLCCSFIVIFRSGYIVPGSEFRKSLHFFRRIWVHLYLDLINRKCNIKHHLQIRIRRCLPFFSWLCCQTINTLAYRPASIGYRDIIYAAFQTFIVKRTIIFFGTEIISAIPYSAYRI